MPYVIENAYGHYMGESGTSVGLSDAIAYGRLEIARFAARNVSKECSVKIFVVEIQEEIVYTFKDGDVCYND